MSKLIDLWLEQTDAEKLEFKKIMEEQLNEIEFWETHQIVGDEEAGTSFIIPVITFDFPIPTVTDETDTVGGCTRIGTVDVPGDCLSSEICSYCNNPPERLLKGYDCYD